MSDYINKHDVEIYVQKLKDEARLAESRVRAQTKRSLQPTADALYVVRNGLRNNIQNHKTSMTEMSNYLAFIDEIISNLKDQGLLDPDF